MKIQATISGFQGAPCTIIGSLEPNGVLVLVKEIKFREDRAGKDFALISNLNLPSLDMRFEDAMLSQAIRTYYTRKSQMTLEVMKELQRFLPDHKIQLETVDEHGRRYRLADDISNGQMAILAAIQLAENQGKFAATTAMINELTDFMVTSI